MKNRVLTVIAVFCTSIPVYFFILWGIVVGREGTQKEKVALFLDHFPGFMQDSRQLIFIGLGFAAGAVLLSIFALQSSKGVLNRINTIVLVVASVMVLLNLFWLM